jgi:hypothetical protein
MNNEEKIMWFLARFGSVLIINDFVEKIKSLSEFFGRLFCCCSSFYL